MKNLKLKSARAELDMSQAELAQAVGVTRQTINLIESGEYNPTIKLCVAICRVLRKTLDQIFWVEETTQIKEENQKEGRVAI
ncbi:MAG: helix-turn-helix transcriptional regulator [Roseburia sp.]|nr:helix-turn-helix transcriptional regulator [Roseburia sp.]